MCYPRNLALSAAFPSKILLDRLARVNTRPVEGSQTCLRTGLAPPSALVSPHPTVTGSWCLLRSVSPTYANGRHTVVTDPIASSSGSMSLLVLHHRGVAKRTSFVIFWLFTDRHGPKSVVQHCTENGSLVSFCQVLYMVSDHLGAIPDFDSRFLSPVQCDNGDVVPPQVLHTWLVLGVDRNSSKFEPRFFRLWFLCKKLPPMHRAGQKSGP